MLTIDPSLKDDYFKGYLGTPKEVQISKQLICTESNLYLKHSMYVNYPDFDGAE